MVTLIRSKYLNQDGQTLFEVSLLRQPTALYIILFLNSVLNTEYLVFFFNVAPTVFQC